MIDSIVTKYAMLSTGHTAHRASRVIQFEKNMTANTNTSPANNANEPWEHSSNGSGFSSSISVQLHTSFPNIRIPDESHLFPEMPHIISLQSALRLAASASLGSFRLGLLGTRGGSRDCLILDDLGLGLGTSSSLLSSGC